MIALRAGRANRISPTFGGTMWNDARRPLHWPFAIRPTTKPTADNGGPRMIAQGGFGALPTPLGLVNPTPNAEGSGPCMAV
jgi:hypothetical protein